MAKKIAPRKSLSLASSIDILPTVLAAIELEIPNGLKGVNLLDRRATEARECVFGEDFTIRSQTLDDPAANVLWRWVTDGRWRLVLPRTLENDERLKSIPTDRFLTPYLQATLQSAQPMLFDLQKDPNEENNIAGDHPEIVASLRKKLDSHWIPKTVSP